MAREGPRSRPRRIIIIGGGASGVLLACHLLREPGTGLRVTLIEKRDRLGRGIAFGTGNADHILNVRAANMSAFADQPDHFWKWLVASGESRLPGCSDSFCFVPRRTYGRYLEQLLDVHRHDGKRPGRLDIVQGECVSLRDTGSGVAVTLADGTTHLGHCAVLATGHDAVSVLPGNCAADPWDEAALRRVPPDAAVLVVGTGLTMVDYVLSLVGAGHEGPILAMSRRGLLPQVHGRVEALSLDVADIPLGTDLDFLWRWVRRTVDWHRGRDGDWRGAMDGLRPFVQQIWRDLPIASKRRFLRHARTFWDVHRHRMAPEVARKLAAVVDSGQLRVVAAKVVSIAPNAAGALVQIRRRGEPALETLQVARVVECMGFATDPRASPNPVVRDLIESRQARPDPIGIGIEVGSDCGIVDASGKRSERIFAVGPLTRAAFWEVTAVPDIRVQCGALARHIAEPRLGADGRASTDPSRSARPQGFGC